MKYKVFMMDGEQMLVSKETGEAVLKAKSQFVRFSGRMINLKSVSKIEPYYEDVPKLAETTPRPFTRQRYLNALKSMLEGCRQVQGKNAQALADKMEAKYNEALNEEKEVYANPIQDFYKAQ